MKAEHLIKQSKIEEANARKARAEALREKKLAE